MTDLPKTFDPAAIEARWYSHWEEHGLFRPQRPDAQAFTLVNPPPNVTGSLHIGHALDNTLQDIVVRYERMRGKDALWVVGTDHAGIATQMVVERQLEAAGSKRTNFSREEFIAKVWEWKEESGGQITRQLRRLGCSMDWSREQFTMDPHFSRAVTKVFVDLYNDGLIYRDKRLVNWDPKLKTAISDLEVETRDVAGGFWTFRYPLSDGSGDIRVSTTRPETMLADTAVAVHPEDERYRELVARGATVRLPITGREVPIVADEHADPELGSGAVKITPGHDFNDFEVARRAGIEARDMLNMFDAEARVVQTSDGLVPEELIGLERFEARRRVVALMKEQGFLVPWTDKDGAEHDAEPRTIPTPFGDRGGVEIEPWLTDQWYVDAAKLAERPIAAVRSGEVEIVPKSWEKTFFNWMENIQPWCVSRQLWWGHRVPAWYGPLSLSDDEGGVKLFVAATEYEVLAKAQRYYGDDVPIFFEQDGDIREGEVTLQRDRDVLDTWFSSALWPFATLGWPGQEPSPLQGRGRSREAAEGVGQSGGVAIGDRPHPPTPSPEGEGESLLHKHYPNDLLISGFDILFFWDARMLMMGYYNMGEAPWKRLYLHGLVRAADGQKMSKSKGNVVDPLGLIDRYGADALRFFMAATESQGRDIKLDERRVEGYRNFATKLWNATRFCQANGIGASTSLAAPPAELAVNRWIIGEVVETLAALDKALADLRFDAAADAVYHFVWDRFCDWYLELVKPVLQQTPSPEGEGEQAETRRVAGWVLDQILVMLHPFIPFVTEELWQAQGARGDYPLITAKWPEPDAEVDGEAKAEVEWLIDVVKAIRSARTELNIAPGTRMSAYVAQGDGNFHAMLRRNWGKLNKLARVEIRSLTNAGSKGSGAVFQVISNGVTYYLELEGIIDIAAEQARLAKALEASRKEADALAKRLGNPAFVEKAKPEAVEKARADHAHHQAEAERLEAALARLG